MVKKTKTKFPSELRLDLTSKDWVIIATGRARKPKAFKVKRKKERTSKKFCPFCQIQTQGKPFLIYNQGKKVDSLAKWTTAVIPNKFPAFLAQDFLEERVEGNLYKTLNAVGYCELVVTRDHQKSMALLSRENVLEVFNSYQERYLALAQKKFVNYISIFHNHGIRAGASQPHPHSQIITTPLIDVDLNKALLSSRKYYLKERKCLYCQMNQWERKVGKRIIFENKEFLVLCPFASKAAFQIIVSPKKHLPYFEKISLEEKKYLVEAFQTALFKLYRGLADPDYNFYLHTAPCNGKKYPYYHWHWTILPKTSTSAGFELGARMEISTITPEKAAEYLRRL